MVKLYYWRGEGLIGSLVRHSSSSPWAHVALAIELEGVVGYVDVYPGAGFRFSLLESRLPEGVQDIHCLKMTKEEKQQIFKMMSNRPYSKLNGVLTIMGINRKSHAIQCAQAVMEMLEILGLHVECIPEPGALSIAVERITDEPVRIVNDQSDCLL